MNEDDRGGDNIEGGIESVAPLPQENVERIHNILIKLDRTDLFSIFADLCRLRGWSAASTVEVTETVGEVVLRQMFPFSQSIAVVYHEDELTGYDVENYLTEFEDSDESRLLIISHTPTEKDAFNHANNEPVTIIGTMDIAEEATLMSVNGQIESFINDAESNPKLTEQNKEGDQSTLTQKSAQADRSIIIEKQFFDVEVLGYDYHSSSEWDTEGIVFAVKIRSKGDDLVLKPSDFTLCSTHGSTYSGIQLSKSRSSDAEVFARELHGALPVEWPKPMPVGWVPISGGSQAGLVIYFPCGKETKVDKIQYKSNLLRGVLDISDKEIESKYGITRHVKGDNELGAWEEYSFDILLTDGQYPSVKGLPGFVRSALTDL